MDKTSVLISEFMDSQGIEELQRAGLEARYEPDLWQDRQALLKELEEAQALIVRNQTRVNPELFQAAPRLSVVGRLGVGLDNIDMEEARARGIRVVWPRGANAVGVAEYVVAALLLFSRNLSGATQHVAEGGWDRTRFGGFEIRDKSLGLVGLGDIGAQVAMRARALGMKIRAVDPARDPDDDLVVREHIELVDLDGLLEKSHFVSLHVPSTPETRQFMNRERFSRMRPGSYLINSARGDLLENAALAEALRSGHLAGAVLDVVDQEPLPETHPFREIPNLWITPHVAGLTREAQERITQRVTREVAQALRGGS